MFVEIPEGDITKWWATAQMVSKLRRLAEYKLCVELWQDECLAIATRLEQQEQALTGKGASD